MSKVAKEHPLDNITSTIQDISSFFLFFFSALCLLLFFSICFHLLYGLYYGHYTVTTDLIVSQTFQNFKKGVVITVFVIKEIVSKVIFLTLWRFCFIGNEVRFDESLSLVKTILKIGDKTLFGHCCAVVYKHDRSQRFKREHLYLENKCLEMYTCLQISGEYCSLLSQKSKCNTP